MNSYEANAVQKWRRLGTNLIRVISCLALVSTTIIGLGTLGIWYYTSLPQSPSGVIIYNQRLAKNESLMFWDLDKPTLVLGDLLFIRFHWFVHQKYRPPGEFRLGRSSFRFSAFDPAVTERDLLHLPELSKKWSLFEEPFFATAEAAQLAQSRLARVEICIPLWFIALLSLLYPLWWFFLGPVLRRRRRIAQGHCLRCDYNLTGNTSGVCPECGTKINDKTSA